MQLHTKRPAAALNKAYLKIAVNRIDIDRFKDNLRQVFERINATEREENFKNIVADFLKDTYYKPFNEINTKYDNDLVIYHGETYKSAVGVLLEVKRPSNTKEMLTAEEANVKALQQILMYYLKERYLEDNKEIKHLIVTNIYDWFIFDASVFERFFFEHKKSLY